MKLYRNQLVMVLMIRYGVALIEYQSGEMDLVLPHELETCK